METMQQFKENVAQYHKHQEELEARERQTQAKVQIVPPKVYKPKLSLEEKARRRAARQARKEAAQTKPAEPVEAEPKKKPLPIASTEGKYEARVVSLLFEVMTGQPTNGRPQLVRMPETVYEPIVLVLSSTEQFYYRVTPTSCTCKGWAYRHKCRHNALAFPEDAKAQAEENARARNLTEESAAAQAQSSALDAVKAALQERGLKVSNVRKTDMESLTIKVPFKNDPTPEDEAQKDLILQTARSAAPGTEIFITSM